MTIRHHAQPRPTGQPGSTVLIGLIAIGAILLGAAGCNLGDGASTAPAVDEETVEAEFTIEGMTCASCTLTVKTAAKRVPGVADARVSLDERRAWVAFDASQTTPVAIAKAISDAGYPAELVITAAETP